MSYIVFNDKPEKVNYYAVTDNKNNTISVIFKGPHEVNTSGFKVFSDDGKMIADYSKYKTLFWDIENISDEYSNMMLSNDGSIYESPKYKVVFNTSIGGKLIGTTEFIEEDFSAIQTPTPTPEKNYKFIGWSDNLPSEGKITSNYYINAIFEYVPTIDDIKQKKIENLREICKATIENGTGIEIRKERKYFSYNAEDQRNIKELFDAAMLTQANVSYHADNEECQDYSALEFAKIYLVLAGHKNEQTSYFNALKEYINSLTDADVIEKITYGTELPSKFKEIYNQAINTNTALMMAILTKNGVSYEDIQGL